MAVPVMARLPPSLTDIEALAKRASRSCPAISRITSDQ